MILGSRLVLVVALVGVGFFVFRCEGCRWSVYLRGLVGLRLVLGAIVGCLVLRRVVLRLVGRVIVVGVGGHCSQVAVFLVIACTVVALM